jgi:PAS domain S-box-containing protein
VTGDDVTERHQHGAELERQRNFLNAIANNAPSLLCLIDEKGIVAERASNIAFERTLEYDPSATGGDTFWEKYVHPDEADEVRDRIQRVVAGEALGDHDNRWVTSAGRSLVIAWSCTALPQIDERLLFLVSGTDVTERKRQEVELERQRDFLSALGDASPSLLVVIDPDGRVSRDGVNLTARRLTGYDRDEIDGRLFWEVFPPPDEAERVRGLIEEAIATGQAEEYETHWVAESGERRLVAWSCTKMPERERRLHRDGEELGPAGLAVPYLIAGSDITERARQRDALRRERDFLSMVANATPAFLCVVDAAGRITEDGVNRAFGEKTGFGDADARGRIFAKLVVAPEDREEVVRALADVFAGGPSAQHESCWETRSGERMLVEWTAIPLEQARENQFLIAAIDVTQRKRQEEELRRERDFGHTVTDTIPSLLVVLDSDWRIAEGGLNSASERLLGYCEDELVGKSFVEALVAPADADRVAAALAAVTPGGEPVEHDTHWLTYEGEPRLISWSCTALPGSDPPEHYLVSGLDITERRRQEEELRRSRARLVEAGDLERRRLERNLHDGAQQRLVSLSLSLRLAQSKLATDAAAAGKILEGASMELAHALEELRELARGIHPAVLTDRGLGPALESLADRSPLPVELEAVPEERLPGPVEAAAFYVVSEALTNVAKYAQASFVRVRVEQLNGYALVEVADDGVGGADPAGGSGLRGLADRVAALDGRLEIASPPGEGTSIRAEIPVEG